MNANFLALLGKNQIKASNPLRKPAKPLKDSVGDKRKKPTSSSSAKQPKSSSSSSHESDDDDEKRSDRQRSRDRSPSPPSEIEDFVTNERNVKKPKLPGLAGFPELNPKAKTFVLLIAIMSCESEYRFHDSNLVRSSNFLGLIS